MSENLQEAISLEEAVDKMMGLAPEATDEPAETEVTDGAEQAEPEVADAEAVVETEEADEPETEPVFEVETVDGKQTLTLSQLKEGAMLKADYTRKTMALSEDRKAVEAEKSEVSSLKMQLAEALQTWAVPAAQEPNWADLATKLPPQDYNKQRAMWEQRKQQADLAGKAYRAMQERQHAELIAQEQERLFAVAPELRDPAKFEAVAAEFHNAGKSYGFSAEEVAQIADHRMLLVLRDAAAYRKLKEAQPAVTKKVAQAAPALKAGSKPDRNEASQAARQQQHERLKKTGSIEDAVALLFR